MGYSLETQKSRINGKYVKNANLFFKQSPVIKIETDFAYYIFCYFQSSFLHIDFASYSSKPQQQNQP